MTITEQFKAKRCVFSIECFPPRQTTQMDKLKTTLQQMQTLNPGFISVTFGAGGSAGGVSTAEVADYIQNELQIPTLAHLICMGNDPISLRLSVSAMYWPCAATAAPPGPKARTSAMQAT